LSQSAAILTAKSLGANQPEQARSFICIAIFIGLGIGALTAILYIFLPKQLSLIFMRSDMINTDVIQLATQFFLIAAVFQFFDSIQVISVGALRGYKDTFVPMCLGGLSYWIFGLTFGYLLAFHWGVKGAGLWWGLAIGIGISGMLLLLRLKQLTRRHAT
jgi:multidrug resistance protein, MATE family